jgi:hypothetical protein
MADTWTAINSLLGSRFSDQAAAQTALEKALNAGTSRLGQLLNDDAVAAEPNASPPVVGSAATARTAVAADIIDIVALTLIDIVETNEDYVAKVTADVAAAATVVALKPA